MDIKFNFGIIINPGGSFGGAQRRFTNLFLYLYKKYPLKVYFFVSYDLYERIIKIYPDYPLMNVIPIGKKVTVDRSKRNSSIVDKVKRINTQKDINLLRKIFKWYKNYSIQLTLFNEIEKHRKAHKINVLMGVYAGILPLYFYFKKKKRNVGIIFCDMDSWFFDILPKEKKYWYRKYSSFNYALENSDYIDFLSPFILDGVRERGIKIKEETVSITPCSFTDYSKCRLGNKNIFQVAFAGRLEKDKNPELFLEAAIILSKKYPEIVFHIMGEGRLSADIKEKLSNLSHRNIIFHGFYPNPTEILADTSVFISIQTTNNYPSQSVLEAMGCGNAIIATDVGDTRMFINEDNGILIDLNVSDLVNAIETLYLDEKLRNSLGMNAFSYVRENHTIEKAAEYYVSLFEKAYSKFSNKKLGRI